MTVVVEIGNDWLKVAEGRPSPKAGLITKIHACNITYSRESIVEVLKKTFKDMRLRKKNVITYIPGHLVTTRILEFPSLDPKEIKDMLSLQVGKHTPYSKEEIVFGHKIMGVDREGYTKVMLVIARRCLVSDRMEDLQQAGIRLDKVGLGTEAAYNWFLAAHGAELNLAADQAIALLDVDFNFADLMIIKNKRLAFIRNILIGITNLSAEPEKWQPELIARLRHSIELYQKEDHSAKLEKLLLSGAGRSIKDLDIVLNSKLGIPCEFTDPSKNIDLKKGIDLVNDERFKFISLSPLLGAALKASALELNFTPPELQIQRLVEARRRQLALTGLFLISIVMTVSSLLSFVIYNKKSYLTQLSQRIAEISGEAGRVEDMRRQTEFLQNRMDARGTSLDMLNELYRLLPKEVYLTSVSIDEKEQAVLRGRAFSMSDVVGFVSTLEDSPYFENVKTTYTTTKKENETEYAEFEVIAAYQEE